MYKKIVMSGTLALINEICITIKVGVENNLNFEYERLDSHN